MPWRVQHNHMDCADGEWAVVAEDDGEVMGCHATEHEAEAQRAALYASEEDAVAAEALGGKPNPGTDKDKRLRRNNPRKKKGKNDDDETAEADVTPLQQNTTTTATGGTVTLTATNTTTTTEAAAKKKKENGTRGWKSVLVVEGTPTGDGREFAIDALDWAVPPLPLRWQKEGSHGGMNDVTVQVGRIDAVWKEGNQIWGAGVFDLGSADGAEAARRVEEKFLTGVSVDVDDIAEADIEFIWPDDSDEDDDGDILSLLFGAPEKMIFHGGRIRAATVVDIPAFVETSIELVDEDELGTLMSERQPVAGTEEVEHYGSTSKSVSGASWDGSAGRFTDEQYEFAAAACDEGEGTVKQRCFLPHHEPGGATNRAGVHAAAQRVSALSGRSAEAVARAKSHLRGHYAAMDEEPPDSIAATAEELAYLTGRTDRVLVASASGPDWTPPPIGWFRNPRLSVPTPILVAENGRIYGHAARWSECHIGVADTCVTLPHEDEHAYFATGEVLCAGGKRVAVGQITLGTGHAPLHYSARRATEHYDNTGAAVADVAVGNDQYGLWVAGMVRPGTSEDKIHALRASGQVSGDWRRIGGQLRLVGLLAVNIPGFPVPKLAARVASGLAEALVAAGHGDFGHGLSEEDLNTLVDAEIERREKEVAAAERRRTMAALAQRVRGGQ